MKTRRGGGNILEFGKQKAMEETEDPSSLGIPGNINEIRAEMNTLISRLSAEFKNELKRYEVAKQTVTTRRKELEDIFELQKQASDLFQFIKTYRLRREMFEQELQVRMMALENAIFSNYKSLQVEICSYSKERWNEKTNKAETFELQKENFQYRFIDEKGERLSLGDTNEHKEKSEFPEDEKQTFIDRILEETFEKFKIRAENQEALIKQEFADEKHIMLARIQALEQRVIELSSLLNREKFSLEKIKRA
ncbi:hypothetical protein JW935_22055 [candidate division KSB1 bacterium]|nr:hypothetical protein [candidate division KSB1 bacterium]